jgi:hypothetical protein
MTIKVNTKDALDKLSFAESIVDKITKQAYQYFVDKTPIKSGNARRSTRLRDTTIEANYPYAKRLDEGYSKQAPRGMVEPTIKEIDRLVRNELRKKK